MVNGGSKSHPWGIPVRVTGKGNRCGLPVWLVLGLVVQLDWYVHFVDSTMDTLWTLVVEGGHFLGDVL